MTNLFSLLHSLKDRLHVRAPRTAEWEARMILRHVIGEKWQEKAIAGNVVTAEEEKCALELAERRVAGEPLAYVLGDAAFGELELKVGTGVLIPRVETELLVNAAVDICRKGFLTLKQIDVLDLGTGSGCIALAVAAADERVRVDAVENAPDALKYASLNVLEHSSGRQVRLVPMDYLKDSWDGRLRPAYHLILANPPYVSESDWEQLSSEVRKEPRQALVGGPRGDEILRRILELARPRVASGGFVVLEMGIGQAAGISRFAESIGFSRPRILSDHQGIERTLILSVQ